MVSSFNLDYNYTSSEIYFSKILLSILLSHPSGLVAMLCSISFVSEFVSKSENKQAI
jgi:hypothetical protein